MRVGILYVSMAAGWALGLVLDESVGKQVPYLLHFTVKLELNERNENELIEVGKKENIGDCNR